MSELQEPGKRKNMKIKSKAAVKTVTAKKTRTTVKKAAPKAAAKPVEKSVTFTVRAEPGVRRSGEQGFRAERPRHAQQRDHGQVKDPFQTTAVRGTVSNGLRPIRL